MDSFNQPKSNIASIFVALLSLGLIFFAVILLNQTFTNRIGLATDNKLKSNSNNLSSKLDVASSNSNKNSLSSTNSAVIETIIGETQNVNQNSKNVKREVIKISEPSFSSTSSSLNSVTTKVSTSSSISSTKSLEATGFIARYTGGGSNEEESNFEIVNCTIKDPIRCKVGTKFYYSDYLKLKETNEYRFINPKIQDSAERFSIESEGLVEN